jgi:hypothetical protein
MWEAAMSTLTRKDVIAMVGELDEVVIAKIIATGATIDELAEAHAWLANDEPFDERRSAAPQRPGCALGRHRCPHQRGRRARRNGKAGLNDSRIAPA